MNLSAQLRKFHSRPHALSFAAGASVRSHEKQAKKSKTVQAKMSKRAARFTLADIVHATRVAKRHRAEAVEVRPDGTIRIVIADTDCSGEAKRDAEEPKLRDFKRMRRRDMPKPALPFLYRYVTRHGSIVFYVKLSPEQPDCGVRVEGIHSQLKNSRITIMQLCRTHRHRDRQGRRRIGPMGRSTCIAVRAIGAPSRLGL